MRLDFNDLCRFFSKVAVAAPDDCHLWKPLGGRRGYGQFRLRGPGRRKERANRIAYLIAHGPDSIPDGLWVLHNCPGGDNPACVNPRHLWLGTAADNNWDKVAKGQTNIYPGNRARGERHGKAKLTEAVVREIRAAYAAGGTSYPKLATAYGFAIATVRRAVCRETWTHLE